MASWTSMFSARLRGIAVALVVAASGATLLLGASLASPTAVAGLGPLPACRYDDILTEPRAYDDWSVTLVDTILEVTKYYVPPDLVPVSDAGIGGSGKIRAVAVADLAAMTAAAKAAGAPIAVQSAYRSYATQQSTFQYWVNLDGYKTALQYSARPGHSEHQLGLAIDFKSAGASSPFSGDWGTTAAGTWMRLHAWQYGWVQSYPRNEQSETCYAYEAWHFRYVGRELAERIHASGLTSREYLWAHFTTAYVPLVKGTARPSAAPAATSRPSATAAATPDRPSASPAERPSPSPSASAPASAQPTADATASSPSASLPPDPAAAGASIDPGSLAGALGVLTGFAALALVLAGRRRHGTVGEGLQQY